MEIKQIKHLMKTWMNGLKQDMKLTRNDAQIWNLLGKRNWN